MNKITLVQSTPGSWSGIDILVNGVLSFYASKQGTSFWVIVTVDGHRTQIGYGGSKSEIKKTVAQHIINNTKEQ